MAFDNLRLSADEVGWVLETGSLRNAQIAKVLRAVVKEMGECVPPDVWEVDSIRTLLDDMASAAARAENASGVRSPSNSVMSARPSRPGASRSTWASQSR